MKLTEAHEDYAKSVQSSADNELRKKADDIESKIDGIKKSFDELQDKVARTREITAAITKSFNEIEPDLNKIILSLPFNNRATGNGNGNEPPKADSSSGDDSKGKGDGEDGNESASWSFFDYLLFTAPFILLIIASGVGVFWLKRQIEYLHEQITTIQQRGRSDFDHANNNINKLSMVVKEHNKALEMLQTRTLPTLEANFKNSLARVETYQQRGRAQESVIDSYGSALPIANYAPQHTTVAEYLTRATADSVKAKKVLMRADALQEASDGDAIYLLSPDEKQHGMFKAIPNYPRFSSSQDYSHYAPFYDCDEPSSGEVWIIEPALATYETELNQWRLYRKGKLQIS